jgi:pyruvate dehydrogenase E1 component beta subunit
LSVSSTPISESGIVGLAIGASATGCSRSSDHVHGLRRRLHGPARQPALAKMRYMFGGKATLPVTVRTMFGGRNMAAQHSQRLETWFCHVPGLKVVMPSNPTTRRDSWPQYATTTP